AVRTDYDALAESYDQTPYRAKEPDPALLAFGRARRALDLGCGTGNQQIANRSALPGAVLVGADRFRAMLAVAARKSRAVHWVQLDGARLPFRDGAFDYVSDQYSLHHVPDKAALVREVYRVLGRGGRFVLQNISPERMRECALFRYFPSALERDLADFASDADHEALFERAGFARIRIEQKASWSRVPAEKVLAAFRDKKANSELDGLTDAEW